MKRIQETIELTETISLVEKLSSLPESEINSKDISEANSITFEKLNKGLKFKLEHDGFFINHDKWDYYDLKVKLDSEYIEIPYLYVNNMTQNQQQGVIPSFNYRHFDSNNKKTHALILPVDKKPNFVFSVENVLIEYNDLIKTGTREATEITINDETFHLFTVTHKIEADKKRFYLVVNSCSDKTYKEFSEICFSILISFGFVSGNFINDDGFFIQYSDQYHSSITGVRYNQLRGSIKCQYVPIYSNPYGYIHDTVISNKYKNIVRGLSISELSKLCAFCHSNSDIKSILLLLIEVHKQSLVSGPATLSVALETITNVIYQEKKSKAKALLPKGEFRKLKAKLIETLSSEEFELKSKNLEILTKRIEQLNHPTNKDKLLIPFEILKIPLTSQDIETIEQRNAFLHGRNPMINNAKPENINEEDKLRYYLYLNLYVLVSSLLLKYVGFDNLVINYPKIMEESTGIEIEGEHYKQI